MRSKQKLFWVIGVLVGLALLLFLLNLYVRNEVKSRLSKLEYPVTYEELQVNVLLNTFGLREVQTRQRNFDLNAQKVQINGVSYYDLLFGEQLQVDQVEVEQPVIVYFPQDTVESNDSQKKQIKLNSFLLKNGNFSRRDSDTSEVDLHVRFPEVEIKDLRLAEDFQFASYRAQLDSVYFKMNAEHAIYLDKAEAEDGRVVISNFRINPFDSKAEFDQKIPYEKDRISLEVSEISMENFSVEQLNDTTLIKESKMVISEAFMEIYRNKLVKDDVRRKALYSELLRKAPIKLNIEKILIEDSEIIYEERVQEGRKNAIIRFADVSAEIDNLHNLPSAGLSQPQISARANFMRGTPVNLNWTFPVFDPDNHFTISGNFGALEGEALDPFLVPALDLQARGKIKDIRFNFSGKEDVMTGEFTMNYEELEVELLKDEGEEKRGFLSSIANLFVNNEGDENPGAEGVDVERDKQRSFWNYVWLGLREGFLDTVSQI